MRYGKRKAQNTLEFCVLTACCAAALLAMSGYIIRAMQGNWKEQADQLGSQYAPGLTVGTKTDTATKNSSDYYYVLGAADFSDKTGIPLSELPDDRNYFLHYEVVYDEGATSNTSEQYEGF
jgi:hypothetical protein